MAPPVRDPMRDIDLMVLGDVGTSTPLPSTTREHRIQLASRTREPASTLLPLMARPPNFEAEFVFKHFCTLCATLCAGPLISQDLDRRAGSKRAHKGGGMRSPMRRALISKDLDRRDGLKKDDTSRK